jgi:ABC-type amino acid transport substrate-binding protein
MIDDPATRLRDLPADAPDPDPRFLDRLHDELARELGLSVRRAAPVAAVTAPTPTRRDDRTGSRTRPTRLLLAAALVMIGTTGGLLVAGGTAPSTSSDLLAEVRARGELRVGVPALPNGDIADAGAFNAQVALLLGERLGISTTIIEDPGIAAPTSWDVAIPEAVGSVDPTRFATSEPVYYVPVWLVGGRQQTKQLLTYAQLGGLRVCAVEGSLGAAWLAGAPGIDSSTPIAAVPADLSVVLEPTDRDCLAGLSTRWDLYVTAGVVWNPTGALRSRAAIGPNSRGALLDTEGDPVLTLPVPLIAPLDVPDPASLLMLVDSAIAGMRADGTLADVSRAMFFRDLSVPPSTDGRRPSRP